MQLSYFNYTIQNYVSRALRCYFLIIVCCYAIGCKKFVEADLPIDKQTSSQVFATTESAVLTMSGIYGILCHSTNNGVLAAPEFGLSIGLGQLADELRRVQAPFQRPEYINNLNGSSDNTIRIWNTLYQKVIYGANSVISGVSASTSLPDQAKQILIAEAKFIRALSHFYLVNLYGDVPLILTTDFMANANIGRSTQDKVYELVIKDLLDAQARLPENYLQPDLLSATAERIRPTKWAATALLARVYLYTGQWQKAEEEATKLINNTTVFELLPLNDVFVKNSKEAIWQLQPNPLNSTGTNVPEAKVYLSGNITVRYAINFQLYNSFEADDLRVSSWLTSAVVGDTTYYFPFKYKIGRGNATQPQEEYAMVFRLGEQYLLRAEARAQQNKLTGAGSAKEDLDVIRTRAGLPQTSAATQTEMLEAIQHERRIELFSELGHRWLDLKRTGQLDAVMSIAAPAKGAEWAPYKALLPIPVNEFKYNPTLRGHQNPGYPEQ